jgi:hypothetical protein
MINNVFNEDIKRAHSPKKIIHKKIHIDSEQNNIDNENTKK